jgi:hypothetical protein
VLSKLAICLRHLGGSGWFAITALEGQLVGGRQPGARHFAFSGVVEHQRGFACAELSLDAQAQALSVLVIVVTRQIEGE